MISGHFTRLEAMFLARSFQVPVEPVQKSDVVVTDCPPGTRRHFDINDWSKLGPDVILIA